MQVLRGRVRRDLKNSEKTWKIMSEWNANSWSSAARSLLWWSVLRGCNDATSASNSSKNFVVPSILAVGHRQSAVARIARFAGAKSQLERHFVHIGGEYVSSNERSLVWREIDAAFESRILRCGDKL